MKSRPLALCGVLAALAVTLLCLGSVIPAAVLCAPILAMAVLLPVLEDGDEDTGEVVILKVDKDEDEENESYVAVEDEALRAVFQIFKEKFADEFNFTDED